MKIKFWGVRGAVPCPGLNTVRYGGNTICIELRFNDPDRLIIIDAGSGIRALGNEIMAKESPSDKITADIIITHTHMDHIQGLPYFAPLYVPKAKLRIIGPASSGKVTLKRIVSGLFSYNYFQINESELDADIKYLDINEGKVDLGYDEIRLFAKYLNHPIRCLGYRFEYNDKVICTAYDTEPFRNLFNTPQDDPLFTKVKFEQGKEMANKLNQWVSDFFKDADLLIHDGQYTEKEYQASKIGFGHTSMEYAIESAKKAGVKKLVIIHHDPNYSDDKLDALSEKLCNSPNSDDMQVIFAKEGMKLNL